MTIHYQDLRQKTGDAVAVEGKALRHDLTTLPGFYRTCGKRVFDVSVVLLTLPIAVLIVASLAAIVAQRGGRPFYTQDRVGQYGHIYRIWKLRTMIPDADVLLKDHLARSPGARTEWDRNQKLRDDPRVTGIGRFLRRSSLDELPQLWNVLRGNMSLIGPRPMIPSQISLYPGTAYYDLRPGISGSWQVTVRHTSSFAERAIFDTVYRDRMSLSEDLRILGATLRVVLRGTGC